MTLFIIIGVLVPMVYTMQLNIKNEPVTKRNLLMTVILSSVGLLVTALAGVIVTKQSIPLFSVAVGLIFTGVVWALLLSGSYALLRFLSNAFGRK
ncbi:hypothetical protein LHK20_01180 [Staphylococcus argenteus]|nr:hypothetical protein [Staphylococcus argenteus]MCG9800984.1 hypothetical protein [Staphylococcus argenteus]MCG9820932.1 hypothetical protein [Staphylococcus argenteus]MCG9831297.1 hypothetical protein [Staphylococcus argenteus]MCG9858427.1 hypothetical protein [Staphylococcus argenteus]